MRNYRRRHRKMLNDIPLTPLIDTALTLLIIFMIASPMVHNAIKINLPKGKVKEQGDVQHSIQIFIAKDQTLYLDGQAFDLDTLVGQLTGMLKTNGENICVKADEQVLYGCVMGVIDRLKSMQGVQCVTLVTKK